MRWSFGDLFVKARRYGRRARVTATRLGLSRRRAGDDVYLGEDFLRRLEQMSLVARHPARVGTVGEHRSHVRASSLEFVDYRHYTAGDDLRRVDWNAYGRLGGLFVKLTEANEDLTLHILVDCSQSMDWGRPNKLHYARQLVAALGYLALARFDAVSIAAFNERLQERSTVLRGKRQAPALLGFLNDLSAGGGTDLDGSLSGYCATATRGGIAVVVSDLHAGEASRLGIERLLRAGLEVTVLHVLHEQEVHPSIGGEFELIDAESGETVEITVGREAIRAYEERVAAWCDSLRQHFVSRGIGYVPITTSAPLEHLVLHHLRERRVVR